MASTHADLAPSPGPTQEVRIPLSVLVAAALTGFAANSLLCRLALARPACIDAASFTVLRLLSGAAMLLALCGLRRAKANGSSWGTAALLLYMFAFSAAYVRIGAALGALLLFATVQATMLSVALARGERIGVRTWLGLAGALGGLTWLVWPGLGAPDPLGGALMGLAGIGWGAYSLLGRRTSDALGTTTGNFAASAGVALVAVAAVWVLSHLAPGVLPSALQRSSATGLPALVRISPRGVALAVASGALASGLGYALWYRAVPLLGASRAAIVQLLVPVVAAGAAVPLLGESLSPRLLLSGVLVLSGVVLALRPSASGR